MTSLAAYGASGRDIGEVGHPGLIRAARLESALNAIQRPTGTVIGHQRSATAAADWLYVAASAAARAT
jgi:hypothetical protein